jgi:hypothetical protein
MLITPSIVAEDRRRSPPGGGGVAVTSGRRAATVRGRVVAVVRRPLLFTVALALVTGLAALVVLVAPPRRVPGTPVPYCTALQVLFDTDGEMRRVADELRRDDRVREVRDERTQEQNFERLTESLRASGHDELADAARVERTPASLRVVEAFGVDAGELAGELRQRHRVNLVDVCERPDELPPG